MTGAYALANPISAQLNKPREQFTREDLLSLIEQRQIQRITFHYTALDGKLKQLKLPVANRRQAERILASGERADGSSLFKGLVSAALSDVYVVPLYRSAFYSPFDSGSLDFLCRYLTADGSPAPFAPDSILASAHNLLKRRHGLELHALGELEFFLLSRPDKRLYPIPRQAGYHGSAPFAKSGGLLDEMLYHITQITGVVKYGHNEVGCIDSVRSDIEELKGAQAEQIEVEFLPAPIDDMGDYLALARWIIRNVAFKHGCVATFTPKLEEGIAGNGLHVHMELREAGRNVMTGDDGQLSERARQVIGGLCQYADSLTAFGNTVSSAYLRLVPNQEAPTRICWSDLNRSALIRVPLGWTRTVDLARSLNPQQQTPPADVDGRQTVELRSPDGSAAAHLLLAGIAMAADWGLATAESVDIARRLYVTGNVLRQDAVGAVPSQNLPRSCVESARVLLQRRDLYEREGVFPPAMIDYVSRLLVAENDENMNAWLADLPADDRLHETRKIMHKDLHRH